MSELDRQKDIEAEGQRATIHYAEKPTVSDGQYGQYGQSGVLEYSPSGMLDFYPSNADGIQGQAQAQAQAQAPNYAENMFEPGGWYPVNNVGAVMPIATNTSGIRPQEYNVLVKPDDVAPTTKGGLIIPESKLEKDEFARTEGTLVAVSPMAFAFSDWPADMMDAKPKVGDRVIFSRYQATEVTGRDGGKYWLMKDKSIAGVIA